VTAGPGLPFGIRAVAHSPLPRSTSVPGSASSRPARRRHARLGVITPPAPPRPVNRHDGGQEKLSFGRPYPMCSGIHRDHTTCLSRRSPAIRKMRARRDTHRRLEPFTTVIHRLSTIGLPTSELGFPCHFPVVHRLPTGLSTSYAQINSPDAVDRRTSTPVCEGVGARFVNAGTGTFRANVVHTNPQASTGCLPSRWTEADTSPHRCGPTLWISMWTDTHSHKRSHSLWRAVDYLLKVLWTTSR